MVSVGSGGPSTQKPRASSATKGRLRLFVVQALVLSLFVTLFARLWYLQVLGGPGVGGSLTEVLAQLPGRGVRAFPGP